MADDLHFDGSRRAAPVRLSKSKLTSYQQCPRRLWLQVHRPEVGDVDPRTRRLFETGHRIGELARLQVPNGILIDPNPQHLVAALAETVEAMSLRRPLFEPAFAHHDVVVRVDILEPRPGGTWRLIEVKNSSAVRPYQLNDVASQAWVLSGCGVKISGVSIRLPTHVLRPGSRRWQPTTFSDVDVTAAAYRLMTGVQVSVDGARSIILADEPVREMGPHCREPFRCEFVGHCWSRSTSDRGSE